MKKLFVGNLSWKATEETLKALFEAYGKVLSVKIITDQYTGKSKGFGFVEMETAEGAAAAIQGLNEKPVLERNIRVSLAQERTERREFTPRSNNSGPSSRGGYRSNDRG
jgi:RNA recognition motif-containing protein